MFVFNIQYEYCPCVLTFNMGTAVLKFYSDVFSWFNSQSIFVNHAVCIYVEKRNFLMISDIRLYTTVVWVWDRSLVTFRGGMCRT